MKTKVTGRILTFSDDFKKLNPHLFGMGGLAANQPEQKARPALGQKQQRPPSRSGGVAYRVTIIACRSRLLDSDNHIGGCKPLRDAIACWLRCDDSDKFIEWEYHQIKTSGAEGTAVRIEIL